MVKTKFKVLDYKESDPVNETKDMIHLIMDQANITMMPAQKKELYKWFKQEYKKWEKI